MHVSSGRPHMLTSNQRGRGKDPVVVLGKIKSAVAVNIAFVLGTFYTRAGIGRELCICSHSENFLSIQATYPKILFERPRDDRIWAVSKFHNNQRIESLFSQVFSNSAVIDVTVFEILEPQLIPGAADVNFFQPASHLSQKGNRLKTALVRPIDIYADVDIFRIRVLQNMPPLARIIFKLRRVVVHAESEAIPGQPATHAVE